jgi:hypothetical protein
MVKGPTLTIAPKSIVLFGCGIPITTNESDPAAFFSVFEEIWLMLVIWSTGTLVLYGWLGSAMGAIQIPGHNPS